MNALFNVVGENFFKPLTSQFKIIYVDCLNIIYDSYRSELSYGTDREILISKLTDYFDNCGIADIQFEEEQEILQDSRGKATRFLRQLKDFGWVESEIGNDQKAKIIMPNHAVTIIQTLNSITKQEEMEYQSEISAIYSLLTNEELLNRPYLQVIKPVYERTLALFTGLKKLNTGIKKYIEELTADKTAEEILQEFFLYHDEIGSKAYHRIKTSDNIARFRNTIIGRLQGILSNSDLFERVIIGYQNIENESDFDIAKEQMHFTISDIIDHFRSYDDIVQEIDRKHSKYIRNAVERAKFLLLNTNNMEGKISTILQVMADNFNRDEQNNLAEDASKEICSLFNMFPQGFLSGESLKTIAISKKITDVAEVYSSLALTEEERELRRIAAYEKNKNRFSRKNVTSFVMELLREKDSINASELLVETRRDMIRVIFINLYGRSPKSDYMVIPTENIIHKLGFCFRDFRIARRVK
ncbi:MAG: hypothetical protein J6M02_05410 [Clostridia bacterium]|nr:hypothetical protein [Clostridia bacterium]